ncbi:aminopeptidase [Clostridium sp. MCC353]|uniref:M55 family metallopeptidase n=1 Tax=Clostridium sp. MCC353 TaxID=2592646 RepID=UPI001C01F95D|nr:M55 family metallopeptidase [Clostridium sp. MCC353]MBT9776800.1 aminopeptidase [Clostridium sp. MCC353]
MKVYISVDFEGISGSVSWSSTNMGDIEYAPLAREMTLEAVAACQGALDAGADEIYVKDAHETGRNMDLSLFPKEVKIINGWTCTPDSMVGGLDASFDAVMFVGYHSPAGSSGSPLSHTMNRGNNYVKFNGELASEFLIHAYIAASMDVPVVFLSGDLALTEHVRRYDPNIRTAAVKQGIGAAAISVAPAKAQEMIREEARLALLQRDNCHIRLPETLTMEINYKDHTSASKASWYPGVKKIDDYTVSYTSSSIKDVMTARMFIL